VIRPAVGFWACVGMVVINVALVCFAPVPEIRGNAFMTAGISAFGALCFWARRP
jgi:hypothetical protein